MRTLIVGLLLALFSGTVIAQPPELGNADVVERLSITDPAQVVRKTGDGWFALELPAIEGTRTSCCWDGNWKFRKQTGCSLDEDAHSYGTTSHSPLEDTVIVYAKVESGEVSRLKVTGEHCPMDGGGQSLTWIGETDSQDTLEFLESLARQGSRKNVSHPALWAMALHADDGASTRLNTLARERDGDLAEQAIFWLGEARGQAGCEMLKDLLDELPVGEKRRHINFALSQNRSDEAVGLLSDIARNDRDPEQRGMALFWLAQENPGVAEKLIVEVIETQRNEEVLEKAVFAMSQLPPETSGPMLLALAQDKNAPREARRQALFWLANSDDEESVSALTEILTR
ncbi:MAG: HEAT repeat domain-containing protein [Xanthomonadales bacterium]|jgi:hypothetical protein|nr:HEAT repeat domain-containing protein [Xanthomonadales bacterium]